MSKRRSPIQLTFVPLRRSSVQIVPLDLSIGYRVTFGTCSLSLTVVQVIGHYSFDPLLIVMSRETLEQDHLNVTVELEF